MVLAAGPVTDHQKVVVSGGYQVGAVVELVDVSFGY